MGVVGAADGDATGFEMSTARMTFDRMLPVVTLDVLAVPAVAHANEVSLRIHRTVPGIHRSYIVTVRNNEQHQFVRVTTQSEQPRHIHGRRPGGGPGSPMTPITG